MSAVHAEPAQRADHQTARRVHRIEVRPADGQRDMRGESVQRQCAAAASATDPLPAAVHHRGVYLLEGTLGPSELTRLATELFADPVTQVAVIDGASPAAPGAATVEVHPLPGVMDPAAESVQEAIEALLGVRVQVRTGERYDFSGCTTAQARGWAQRLLANTVIHAIHDGPFHPASFPEGRPYELAIRSVPITPLDDAQLESMSRSAHLFLSLDEMRAIQSHYRTLGREPREIELETLAQTWSEHCVHKTLKSTVSYGAAPGAPAVATDGRPGHEVVDGGIVIHNLLKSTVAAATHELMADGIDWCLSVFKDNSGVIAFDDQWAVCFKVETHNHPSAIEPYGGSATGIGGCIRDIIGTGRGAKPIASTDIFCVADVARTEVPRGCLHPRRILRQVVNGVRDYGNRMGIPTLNGTVWFDDRYVGNPLVYCGCVGLMPRDFVKGQVQPGDAIVAIGGRTGRDGIHGATFSSAELTDTHADEFSHAVQIGNAITEKRALDAILAARDHAQGCLFSALTDCGAGGFSSAVGEMGGTIGAEVHLDRAPTKYDGLSPTEAWISEAQERLVLSVPRANLPALQQVCDDHGVELCDLGTFGTPDRAIRLLWKGTEVGALDTHFMHDGIPTPTRTAVWDPAWASSFAPVVRVQEPVAGGHLQAALPALLASANIASKEWIIRQYDHEVQGSSVVKPLHGPQSGPGDASVIRPVARSVRGLAMGNGLATGLAADPYWMGLAAIDECVRNLVCVGTDPTRIAILDNFCWPSCKDPRNLGALVRAAHACYDGAKAYRTPFISGKDSLNNQFTTDDGTTIQIPPTLLISGFGLVHDSDHCVTMDLKGAGNAIVLVGTTTPATGGSQFRALGGTAGSDELPHTDLVAGPGNAHAVAALIAAGHVLSAHDCSEGGLLVAVAEMAFAGDVGAQLELGTVPGAGAPVVAAFSETPSRYLLEIPMDRLEAALQALASAGAVHARIGTTTAVRSLQAGGCTWTLDELAAAWRSGGKGW